MGFRKNQSAQLTIDDRMGRLTERELRFLERSWAKPFGDEVFPLIDESRFKPLYCADNGRPNTPVNVVIGSLILKEMMALTDEELLESVLLDIRFQYALHLTSKDEIPYSDRTPSRFRERLYRYELETGKDLLKEEIECLADNMAKVLGIKGDKKRMDSLMVSSSCKKMGRLELMHTCVSNLVRAVIDSGGSGGLPEHLLGYADKSDRNAVCYRADKDEVRTRQEAVLKDALELYSLCGRSYQGLEDYALLGRMLADQTESGSLRPNGDVRPDSLQNPSDPDATYRSKSGRGNQGYVANVVEDLGEDTNIITGYDFDVNLHPDTGFCAEVIEGLGLQEEGMVLIADGAYASEENFKAAEENNIELVTTALTGKKSADIAADFVIEEGKIASCPAGHAPTRTYDMKDGAYRAHFDRAACEGCVHKDECPAKFQKKSVFVRLTQASIRRASYERKLSTDEYKEHARTRNGVEGVPSVLRRRYHVDEMPVRGLLRSKMWFGFKIGAINAKRFIAAGLDRSSRCVFAGMLRVTSAWWQYSRILAQAGGGLPA